LQTLAFLAFLFVPVNTNSKPNFNASHGTAETTNCPFLLILIDLGTFNIQHLSKNLHTVTVVVCGGGSVM